MNRIENIRKVMEKEQIDAMLITSFHNIYYLSGHTSDEAILLITKSSTSILSDFRYTTQIKQECPSWSFIEIQNGDFVTPLNSIINKEGVSIAGFEGDSMVFDVFNNFSKNLHCPLKPINLLEFRMIKDEEEVENIIKAGQIAEEAFNYVVENVIKVGVSERVIAIALETKMKELGASGPSFPSIVASGERGALPHAKPTENLLKSGEMLTIDFGALYKGYCSDITRTFAVGSKPSDKMIEIYNIIKEAQQKAIDAARPGMRCCDVDEVARGYIREKGYGANFGHGLGHGVGIQIHEQPRFSPICDTILEEGMVITVEPGIYVEGLGGVRIEDDILITKDGCKLLTHLPKELDIKG